MAAVTADTSDNDGPSSIARRRKKASRKSSAMYIERRDHLLAAAAEVIKKKGFDAASMNDIAEQAGSDRASVYYYYSNKQEIFQDLVHIAVHENVLIAEGIAAKTTESATLRMERLIVELLDAYERQYPIIHLFLREDLRRASAELQDLGARYEKAIVSITEAGVSSGEFHSDLDPTVVVMAILGAVNWTHRWFTPSGRLNTAVIGRGFAKLFLEGLADPERAPHVTASRSSSAAR